MSELRFISFYAFRQRIVGKPVMMKSKYNYWSYLFRAFTYLIHDENLNQYLVTEFKDSICLGEGQEW